MNYTCLMKYSIAHLKKNSSCFYRKICKDEKSPAV